MRRDWNRSEPVAGQGRFEPHIEFKTDVVPVYAWWNGTGTLALLDEPVTVGPNGKVALYRPEGSIKDPRAKISPFKYHEAKLPIDGDAKLMIPVAVGQVFRSGNNAAGVAAGARAWFGKDVANIEPCITSTIYLHRGPHHPPRDRVHRSQGRVVMVMRGLTVEWAPHGG